MVNSEVWLQRTLHPGISGGLQNDGTVHSFPVRQDLHGHADPGQRVTEVGESCTALQIRRRHQIGTVGRENVERKVGDRPLTAAERRHPSYFISAAQSPLSASGSSRSFRRQREPALT